MSNSFSARIKLLSVALLIAGMVSVVLAYSLKQSNAVKRKPAQGFTLVTKETVIPFRATEPGPIEGYRLAIMYQKSDGTWKRVRT